jgi:hypothetical protein
MIDITLVGAYGKYGAVKLNSAKKFIRPIQTLALEVATI